MDTLLNTHRKDFILKVGDCNFAAAELKPSYITCDGFTLTFENESTSANIHSYYWEFGDPDLQQIVQQIQLLPIHIKIPELIL